MLIPRYSIRTILIITAASAVVFLVVAQGLQGRQWAAAISIGLLAVLVALVVQALLFAAVWAVASIGRGVAGRPPGNPQMPMDAPTTSANLVPPPPSALDEDV